MSCHHSVPSIVAAATILSGVTATPAAAQYPTARVLSRGVLMISLEPRYTSHDFRFDPNGNVELLGTDFTRDSAGTDLIPSLLDPRAAVRSITGDTAYVMSAGAFQSTLDADIRRFPFNFQLGITDRLTLTASLPIVNTRSQVDFVVDSANGNVGWNQAVPEGGNPTGLPDIQALQAQLEMAAASVDAQIAAGAYGCPTSTMCDQARDLVMRTRQLESDLLLLTGVSTTGDPGAIPPPFAPLASSPAGQAVLAAIQSITAQLLTFGAPAVTSTLPLPTARVSTDDFQTMLTSPNLGYEAFELDFIKYRNQLGDAEIGLRWGVIQQPALRTVLSGTIRLPTGKRDRPDHFTDLGTGDRQTDLEGTIEAVWAPGSVVTLAFTASYTLQLGDKLLRRVTSHDRPIALALSQQQVSRNLGDVVRIGVFPSLRLSNAFTAYASAHYFHKQADRFSEIPEFMLLTNFPGAATVDALEQDTRMETLSFGGGIYYRSERGRRAAGLPIEAGVDYHAAFRGEGGLTPKFTTVKFYLRLFYKVFGGTEAAAESGTAVGR